MATGPLSPKIHFYRRPLPPECVSFCSPEGKVLFKEALDAGFMENYFPLAAQFRTQDEPAFCGLSTLVMALNTLEVDPGKIWKGPWRWYHENMLDCCVPINIIAKSGITFDQFSCLAVCNTLKVRSVRADDKTTLEEFREEVKRVSRIGNEVIVASYSRKAFGQSGDGHFSPLGGYHPGKDLVLIMDVARFKYPPHWVSLPTMFQAMQYVDKDTEKPRGYLKLLKSQTLPTVLFSLNSFLCVTDFPSTKLVKFASNWTTILSTPIESLLPSKVLEICIDQLLKMFNMKRTKMIITLFDITTMSSVSEEHKYAMQQILTALDELSICQMVKNCLPAESPSSDDVSEANDVESVEKSAFLDRLRDWHYISMLMLIWPYGKSVANYEAALAELVKSQLAESKSELLQNEVQLIRQQMESVLGYASVFSHCQCQQKEESMTTMKTAIPA